MHCDDYCVVTQRSVLIVVVTLYHLVAIRSKIEPQHWVINIKNTTQISGSCIVWQKYDTNQYVWHKPVSLECGHNGLAFSLQWRHDEHDCATNHQPHECLFNCLFRFRLKKTSKFCVTGLCAGNSPVTGASNAENVSIWWRHHVIQDTCLTYSGWFYLRVCPIILNG